MTNLEQLRAFHALNANGFKRSDVAGFPALIMQNGILAAFAYATEEGKDTRKGMKSACDATAKYLSTRDIPSAQITDAKTLLTKLTATDSLTLQRATAEALAFFAYLKRFAPKE
jgi:CRISPR/Cas system CMR-associated protein Cmr5 small subunit